LEKQPHAVHAQPIAVISALNFSTISAWRFEATDFPSFVSIKEAMALTDDEAVIVPFRLSYKRTDGLP